MADSKHTKGDLRQLQSLPCRRLAAPDLTGMRVLRKERSKYAVICNRGIRRSGVAITEMSGGDRG